MKFTFFTSRLLTTIIGLVLCQLTIAASSSWSFTDATLQVSQKGGEAGKRHIFTPDSPVHAPLSLSAKDTVKILLTTQEGTTAKRPHQLFLLIQDPSSELESFLPFDIKESGKGRVDLALKDIPSALQTAPSLKLSIVIGSFGTSKPLHTTVGSLTLNIDSKTIESLKAKKPLRYEKRDEIHHVYRAEPRSPPKIISIVFTLIVLFNIPLLFLAWAALRANLSHLPQALKAQPIAYPLFFGSLLAFEAVFFTYYTKSNIFQTLAAVGVISPVAVISGSRALREVRERRVKGQR